MRGGQAEPGGHALPGMLEEAAPAPGGNFAAALTNETYLLLIWSREDTGTGAEARLQQVRRLDQDVEAEDEVFEQEDLRCRISVVSPLYLGGEDRATGLGKAGGIRR